MKSRLAAWEEEEQEGTMSKVKGEGLLDAPVPQLDAPVLKPTPYTRPGPQRLSVLANKAASLVNERLSRFADWILSYVPETVKKVANERVEKLKARVKELLFVVREYKVYLRKVFKPGKNVENYRINGHDGIGPKVFLEEAKGSVVAHLHTRKRPFKLRLTMACEFEKGVPGEDFDRDEHYFHSFKKDLPLLVDDATDLSTVYETVKEILLEKISSHEGNGSGWVFVRVTSLDVIADTFNSIKGSSYIVTPPDAG